MLKARTFFTDGSVKTVARSGAPLKNISASDVDSNKSTILASECLTIHLPTVPGMLFCSDRFAASVATGYHTTYPIPRTAVNDELIWSQSLCLACSSGTPIRVSRVVSSGMVRSEERRVGKECGLQW